MAKTRKRISEAELARRKQESQKARLANSTPQNFAHSVVVNVPSTQNPPGLWRSLFGWRAFFRWDVLGALVPGVFIAVGLGMLTVEWFPHNLTISQVCFGIAGALAIVKTVGHARSAKSSRIAKSIFCIALCGPTLATVLFAVRSIESHRPTLEPVLAAKAFVTVGHKKGDKVSGVTWIGEQFSDIRLVVDNVARHPIHNLDFTIEVLQNSGDLLGGVGQVSDLHGVEFNAPEIPDASIRLRGNDGLDYVLFTRDMFAMSGDAPMGTALESILPQTLGGRPVKIGGGGCPYG
jgi:hypothetical protein